MFSGLNEEGQHIMADLEPGEVLTALQSKLDDMNDRWNSLEVRVVDIRDRYCIYCVLDYHTPTTSSIILASLHFGDLSFALINLERDSYMLLLTELEVHTRKCLF